MLPSKLIFCYPKPFFSFIEYKYYIYGIFYSNRFNIHKVSLVLKKALNYSKYKCGTSIE